MRSSLLHRSTQEESNKNLFCSFLNCIVFYMNIQISNDLNGDLNQKLIWKNKNNWTMSGRQLAQGLTAPLAGGSWTNAGIGLRVGHQCHEADMPGKVTALGAHRRGRAMWRRWLDLARRRLFTATALRWPKPAALAWGKIGRLGLGRWSRIGKRREDGGSPVTLHGEE
jgi:hypothetical protein